MKICNKCILPETFPGIRFDEQGVCNFCQKGSRGREEAKENKEIYERKFLELVDKLRRDGGAAKYDVLMAFSGGKDSTYTMALLKNKYKLRILAFSFDNGFISETARRNIGIVTDRLCIDHIMFKANWDMMRAIFRYTADHEMYSPKTLERASTICTSCIGFVKSLCLKIALEQQIPMIGFGWSPGQAPLKSSIMKNNPSLIKMTQSAILVPLKFVVGEGVEAYFLSDRHYTLPGIFPYNVHPMAWEYYNEEMILTEIRKLGWELPGDTDTNSSNCLLNAFANEIHIKRYGFHPYVWEIANMVRQGDMDRQEGYTKIYQEQRSELVNVAKCKLDL